MGTIIIKNMTTLTDFAADMRVGLYMADAGKCVIAIIEKEE